MKKTARHSTRIIQRRVPCLIFYLFFNINRHTGFEFHNEFILVDGDFLNQPLDQSLVKFSEFVRLSGDEFLQLVDALPGLLAAAGVCLGL